jgi:integrase
MPAWWNAVAKVQSVQSRTALQALLLTGLRVNELLSLAPDDVDLTRRELRIRHSKTTSFIKPVGPVLAQMLEVHMKSYPGNRVFEIADLRAALKQVSKFGGKVVTPHDLRRTFVTVAESLDISTLAVKRLVNHAISDVTAGYAQLSSERLGRAAREIEGVIISMTKGLTRTAEVGSDP